MPIITKDRYFGEGISSYGDESPATALATHRRHVRIQRLHDALGKEAKLEAHNISEKFDVIKAAIEAADNQVDTDNAEFIAQHNLA